MLLRSRPAKEYTRCARAPALRQASELRLNGERDMRQATSDGLVCTSSCSVVPWHRSEPEKVATAPGAMMNRGILAPHSGSMSVRCGNSRSPPQWRTPPGSLASGSHLGPEGGCIGYRQ